MTGFSGRRVVLIGTTASGKTWLGKRLAARLGFPFTDLDDLFFLPGWQKAPLNEVRSKAAAIVAENSWIIAGNYQTALSDIIWPRADTLVWIDRPYFLTLFRLLKRCAQRLYDKAPICNNNQETWKNLFSRDSIILWFLNSFPKKMKKYIALFSRPDLHPHLTFIRLKNDKEIAAFLSQFQA